MRRASDVPLTILAVLALSLTGCKPEHRDCVDDQNHLIPDQNCETHSGTAHYWYGGSSGGHVGDAVVGGSSVSHGGFGGIGGSHGGGEGGE